MRMPSPPVALQVVVVGGGIGGLSAAIALRRAGHHVTVYERYAADADAGAGIVVCANATRVLKQWGFDLDSTGMFRFKAGYIIQATTLDVVDVLYGEESNINSEKDNGEAQYCTTRHDLRTMLRQETERQVLGEGSIKFRYGARVLDYDAARPAVKFADGTWVDCDLVVACDGIRSRATKIICGYDNPATPTGRTAFRLLIPDDRLKAVQEKYRDDEFIQDKFKFSLGRIWFAREHQNLLVWWSCRQGQMHAFDVLVPDNEKYISKEDWTAKCDKQILLDEVEHWHPLFRDMFETADKDMMLWKICSREPLKTLHKGKLLMLGDALHPMPPFRAQGGSQSIEDAGALEMVLTNLRDKADLVQRLAILDELRVPRFSSAQLISTVRQDELNQTERYIEVMNHCRKWFEGKDQSHLDNRTNFQKWLLSYDVRHAAGQAVKDRT